MTCIRFVVPIKAPSLTNQREHFRARHARTDAQRRATRSRWPGWEAGPLVVVRLTRVSPRRLDSEDNLPASLKSVRDEVAACLRVDDASPLVRWEYGQEQGREPHVRVEVSAGGAPGAVLGRLLHVLTAQAEVALRLGKEQVVDALPASTAQDVAALHAPYPTTPRAMAPPSRPPESIPEAKPRLPVVEVDASGPVRLVREPGQGERRAPRHKSAKEVRALATPATYPAAPTTKEKP